MDSPRILILGPDPEAIAPIIRANGCRVQNTSAPISAETVREGGFHFAISYRYRHIIPQSVIDAFDGRIINLHISLLPWNRGADPNLWSFLEDTPKGVSIHYTDAGIDTGDIIAQKVVVFDENNETLASTYATLNRTLVTHFEQCWPQIIGGQAPRYPQGKGGSIHFRADRKRFNYLLADEGWETPVARLIGRALSDDRQRIGAETCR